MAASLRNFDPDRLARLDTAMWRAYYAHKFLRLMGLLVVTMRAQFGFGWPFALRAAYYSGRAAVSFRRNAQSEDYKTVLPGLERFYALVRSKTGESFDAKEAARLELEWWLVHRYPKRYSERLEGALAEGAALLYGIPPAKLHGYGAKRAEAMHLRDTAAWKTRTEPDWQKIEGLLRTAYREIKTAL